VDSLYWWYTTLLHGLKTKLIRHTKDEIEADYDVEYCEKGDAIDESIDKQEEYCQWCTY
jgi:hypothetical protein